MHESDIINDSFEYGILNSEGVLRRALNRAWRGSHAIPRYSKWKK